VGTAGSVRTLRFRASVSVGRMAVFSPEVVAAVLHHMNDDHIEDNVLIVRAFADRDVRDATMHDLDEHGGTWHYDFGGERHELRIPWPGAPLTERAEIRRDVVALYDAACEKLGVEARPH
jgi:hypothetical protein